jgi:hypothetical protein
VRGRGAKVGTRCKGTRAESFVGWGSYGTEGKCSRCLEFRVRLRELTESSLNVVPSTSVEHNYFVQNMSNPTQSKIQASCLAAASTPSVPALCELWQRCGAQIYPAHTDVPQTSILIPWA